MSRISEIVKEFNDMMIRDGSIVWIEVEEAKGNRPVCTVKPGNFYDFDPYISCGAVVSFSNKLKEKIISFFNERNVDLEFHKQYIDGSLFYCDYK